MLRKFKKAKFIKKDENFILYLDDKPFVSSSKNNLILENSNFVETIEKEWNSQEKIIKESKMPFTKVFMTINDKIIPFRDEIAKKISLYSINDLLCYRGDEGSFLYRQQKNKWDAWVTWGENIFNAKLKITSGIMPVNQDKKVLEKAKNMLNDLNDLEFYIVVQNIQSLGSFILGLALFKKCLAFKEAYELSILETLFQADMWGETDEFKNKNISNLKELQFINALLEQ